MANAGAGGGAGGSDVRAGGAFVEIFGKDSLTKMMDGMKRKVTSFASSLKSIGTGVGILGGVITAPLTALFASGVNKAVEIDKMAASLGFSREQMQRLSFAAEVAGVSIDEVIENQGRYQDLMKNAPMMDDQTIKDSVTASREFSKALIEVRTAVTPLISDLLPLIKMAGQFVKDNKDLAKILLIVGAGITAVGLAFVGAGAIIGGVVTVFGMLGSILGAILSPIGLIAIGIAGIFYLIATESASGIKMFAEFGEAFKQMGELFKLTFGGIMDAIEGGDLELAFKIASAGIQAIWYTMLDKMGKAFSAWVDANRTRLVTLAGLMGALKGAGMAKGMGPWGAALGIAVGAGAGAVGADLALDEVKKIGDDPAMANKAKAAEDELRKLAEQARKKKIQAQQQRMKDDEKPEHVRPMIAAVRGAFRTLGDARQFGMGETVAKRQLNVANAQLKVQEMIVDQLKMLNKNMAFK